MLSIATLWIPYTITATLGQVAGNAMQRQLTGPLGTCGGTRTALANWDTRITKLAIGGGD